MPEISIGNHFTNVTDNEIISLLNKVRKASNLNLIVERHNDLTKKLLKKTKDTYTVYLKVSEVESQRITTDLTKSSLLWFLKGFYIASLNGAKS